MKHPFRFRDYQHDDIVRLLGCDARLMALFYGVGGGKTPTSLACASLWLESEPNLGVIVCTTQTAISAQFIEYGGEPFEHDGSIFSFPSSYTTAAASRHELTSYLSTEGNREKRMVVADRSVIIECEGAIQAALASGRPLLFILDEAHHTPEVGEGEAGSRTAFLLAKLMGRLHREFSNTRFLKLTGTPYRADDRSVVDDHWFVCSKRLIELMRDGYAPSTVLTSYERIPLDVVEGARAIARRWIADGRPSVVVRIKLTLEIALQPLLQAFREVGASVVDTTREAGGEALMAAVRADAEGELPRGTVFLAKGRMGEGVNVRTLTHAYFWGVPRSMTALEQFLGRIMRMRFVGMRLEPGRPVEPISNVPREWATRSKVMFFFGATEDGSRTEDHPRLLLRAVLFLSTFQHPSWVTKQLLGIDDGISAHRTSPNRVVSLDQLKLAHAIEVIELFQDYVWKVRVHPENAVTLTTHPQKFGSVIYKWYQQHPEMVEDGDARLDYGDIVDALFHRKRVLDARHQACLAEAAASPDDDLVQGVLRDFAPEFHQATFEDDHYVLGHRGMEEWAHRVGKEILARVAGQAKTPDEVFERAKAFRKENGRWPLMNDEDQRAGKPVPFSRYNALLHNLGQPGLYTFVCLRDETDLSATVKDLLGFARDKDLIQHVSYDDAVKEFTARTNTATGQYFAKALLAGGFCEIQYPADMEPLRLLALLERVRIQYSSRKKLGEVKSVYLDQGLDGVRALLGDTDDQGGVA